MVRLKMGIEIIGQSQLVGYPGQFPDVSMMNWEYGRPNARYRVLQLLVNQFAPGDTLVETITGFMNPSDYVAQAFKTRSGKKVLLVNKYDHTLRVKIPAALEGARLSVVDVATGDKPPVESVISSGYLELKPYRSEEHTSALQSLMCITYFHTPSLPDALPICSHLSIPWLRPSQAS